MPQWSQLRTRSSSNVPLSVLSADILGQITSLLPLSDVLNLWLCGNQVFMTILEASIEESRVEIETRNQVAKRPSMLLCLKRLRLLHLLVATQHKPAKSASNHAFWFGVIANSAKTLASLILSHYHSKDFAKWHAANPINFPQLAELELCAIGALPASLFTNCTPNLTKLIIMDSRINLYEHPLPPKLEQLVVSAENVEFRAELRQAFPKSLTLLDVQFFNTAPGFYWTSMRQFIKELPDHVLDFALTVEHNAPSLFEDGSTPDTLFKELKWPKQLRALALSGRVYTSDSQYYNNLPLGLEYFHLGIRGHVAGMEDMAPFLPRGLKVLSGAISGDLHSAEATSQLPRTLTTFRPTDDRYSISMADPDIAFSLPTGLLPTIRFDDNSRSVPLRPEFALLPIKTIVIPWWDISIALKAPRSLTSLKIVFPWFILTSTITKLLPRTLRYLEVESICPFLREAPLHHLPEKLESLSLLRTTDHGGTVLTWFGEYSTKPFENRGDFVFKNGETISREYKYDAETTHSARLGFFEASPLLRLPSTLTQLSFGPISLAEDNPWLQNLPPLLTSLDLVIKRLRVENIAALAFRLHILRLLRIRTSLPPNDLMAYKGYGVLLPHLPRTLELFEVTCSVLHPVLPSIKELTTLPRSLISLQLPLDIESAQAVAGFVTSRRC